MLAMRRPMSMALRTGALSCSWRCATTSTGGKSSGPSAPEAPAPEEGNSNVTEKQKLAEEVAGASTISKKSSASSNNSASADTDAGSASGDAGGIQKAPPASGSDGDSLITPDPEPVRWVQTPYEDPDTLPVVDEKGEYIVSRVQWPTGEIAYTTPPPTDDKLAPRFGYNVVQVKKHVSWWKYNQKFPRISIAYINIQVLFLLGLAWLVAFLNEEYRRTTEAMKTPGAMVGEHRGKGPSTGKTQKVSFSKDEMSALVDKAQNNWFDGTAEANYIGSKDYKMKKIPRPKEFSVDDFRKR